MATRGRADQCHACATRVEPPPWTAFQFVLFECSLALAAGWPSYGSNDVYLGEDVIIQLGKSQIAVANLSPGSMLPWQIFTDLSDSGSNETMYAKSFRKYRFLIYFNFIFIIFNSKIFVYLITIKIY